MLAWHPTVRTPIRWLIACLAVGLSVHASSKRSAEDAYAEEWRWIRFGQADGLPADHVTCIAVARGRTWVGTAAGLAVFDGWRWISMGPEVGLSSDANVQSLEVDELGRVWAVLGSGLFVGTEEGFAQVELPSTQGPLVATYVTALPDGSVLVETLGQERESFVWKCDAQGAWTTFEPPAPLSGLSGRDVWFEPLLGIVVSTQDGVFIAGEGSRSGLFRPVASRPEDAVMLVWLTGNSNGQSLAGVRFPAQHRGVWEWDAHNSMSRVPGEGYVVLSAAAVALDGDAVVVYDTGDVRVRHAGDWRSLEAAPQALREAICLAYRQDGSLWAGGENGLWLLLRSSTRWTQWAHAGPLEPTNRVHEILRRADGSLWFATADGVVARTPEGEELSIPPIDSTERLELTGLAEDERGTVWVCGGAAFAGFHRFEDGRWTRIERAADGSEPGLVHKLRRDRSGRIWALGLAAGLGDPHATTGSIHVIEDGEIRAWEPGIELAHRRLYDCAESRDGTLWFATSLGVSRYGKGVWKHWLDAPDLNARTHRVILDERDEAWLAMPNRGIGHIGADDQLEVIQIDPFGRLGDMHDLAFDGQGRLWASSLTGLGFLEDGEWSWVKSTGLGTPRAWPILPEEDRLLVGTLGGGVWILSFEDADAPAPRVTIEPPRLRGNEVFLRWRPNAWMGMLAPESVETRTRLTDAPKNAWSAWTKQHELHLADLDVGEHRFEVQARGLFGELSEIARGSIVIDAPFYERIAFLLPMGTLSLLTIGSGVLFLRRKRRDEAILRLSEAKHRTLLEQASDAILILDASGACVLSNRKAEELFGTSSSGLRGLTLTGLLSLEDAPGVSERLAGMDAQVGFCVECHAHRAGGARVPVEASLKRLPSGELQAILRDTTERKKIAAERLALERLMVEAQKLESLGLLASGVAHDFNNLLTVMLGNAEEAQLDLPAGSIARQSLRNVVMAAQRAGELTQQLLTFAGRGPLARKVLDLNELLREMRELLHASLERGVVLELDLEEPLLALEADGAQLRQVVLNLILNASDAIGVRGGIIVIRTRMESESALEQRFSPPSSAARAEHWVRLEVADDGLGMDPATLSRIFEPFFTTKSAGRGLGLSSVQGIVRSHGGFLRVESRRGEGSRFVVHLPASPRATDPQSSATQSARGLDGRTILVVDDEAGVRSVVTSMLAHGGARVLSAASGPEAIDIVRSSSGRLDGCVVDMTMPGMSGSQTVSGLRSLQAELPVVLVSGYDEARLDAAPDMRLHTRFLQKPFTARELEESILELLDELASAR